MNSEVKEIILNALKLCAILLVAGILLATIYEITKEPRAEQAAKVKEEANKAVMPDCVTSEVIELEDSFVKTAISEANLTDKQVLIDEFALAYDGSGKLIGYIVAVTDKEGYGGNISFTVGILPGGNINGVSITSIGETSGLGMEAKEDPSFLAQYINQGDGLFVVNKDDNAEGNNIDALSGATITSKAVTNGINAAKLVALAYEKGGEADE